MLTRVTEAFRAAIAAIHCPVRQSGSRSDSTTYASRRALSREHDQLDREPIAKAVSYGFADDVIKPS
jgi:hypothetical protein